MTNQIKESYMNIERAMSEFTMLLEQHVVTLRASEGSDPTKLERLTHGAKAMRDSSSIYLSYAKFIAWGMPDSEEMMDD